MSEENKKIKSEIREDYIHDRFTIVAPGRSKRPKETKEARNEKEEDDKKEQERVKKERCVFCPEKQKDIEGLHYGGSKDDWKVKIIKNIFPAVSSENDKAYGYQEVVIETDKHGIELGELALDQIIEVFEGYINRTRELSRDKKIEYILIFKNKGGRAGASLRHAHSQIFAAGFTPPHIVNKLTRAQEYRIKNGNCYYCDLVQKEESGPRKIMSNEHAIAFTPYASNYQYEAWIMPKKHLDNITVLDRQEITAMAEMYLHIIQKLNEEDIPYNMYLHQSVKDNDEHFYMRVCPRRSTWAGVEMGSRIIINTVAPEDAAKFYRGE